MTRRIAIFSLAVALIAIATGCAEKRTRPADFSWFKTGGLTTSGKYRGVAAVDLDNDSYLDIVGASTDPGKIAIWYGQRFGKMAMPVFLPIKADFRSVAAGDIDGDGFKDIVASAQRESSGIMIWLNKGARAWEIGTEPSKIGRYEGVRLADINNDNRLDVIAANATSENDGGVQVWLGDGRGRWVRETGPSSEGRYMDVEVGDFDGDGNIDIAGASWGLSGSVGVWLGDGTGSWASLAPVVLGNFNGLSVGDIDGDSNADLLAGSYRSGIHIFLGDGTGAFAPMPSPIDTGSYWRAICVDMQTEGSTEAGVMASSIDGKGLRGWLYLGKNRWREIENVFPALGKYYDLKMADLDGDGKDEMIAASYGGGLKVLFGENWPYSASTKDLFEGMDSLEKGTAPEDVAENDVFTTERGFVEYKIGPGDVLEITLWEPSGVTREEVEVMPDGTLSFVFVEDLPVEGLTAKELDIMLTEKLGEYIKSPRVTVTVGRYMSKWVSVLGPGRTQHAGSGWGGDKGRRGGRYYLDGKVSLVELLSGISLASNANLREVLVTRKNGRTKKLNVYKAMTSGDRSQDIVLDSGDSIYVSVVSQEGNRVFVFGEVGSPGAYTFSGSGIRLMDAIASAGGPTVFGRLGETRIVRGDITNPEIIETDIEALMETGDQTQNIQLLDGDLVYVPRSAFGSINLFVDRISPILRLIAAPASAITSFERYYGE